MNCDKCGVWHFDVAVYKRWANEYAKTTWDAVGRQRARWLAIVDVHEGKSKWEDVLSLFGHTPNEPKEKKTRRKSN